MLLHRVPPPHWAVVPYAVISTIATCHHKGCCVCFYFCMYVCVHVSVVCCCIDVPWPEKPKKPTTITIRWWMPPPATIWVVVLGILVWFLVLVCAYMIIWAFMCLWLLELSLENHHRRREVEATVVQSSLTTAAHGGSGWWLWDSNPKTLKKCIVDLKP